MYFTPYHIAAWLFLDETLKKSTNKNDNSETDSIATDSTTTECDIDSVVTIETDLTSDAMVTDDTIVTANGKVIEDSISETTSVEDVKPLLEHHPKVKTNWKAKFWELFYKRIYCCRGFNIRKINYKLSRRDLLSARDKIITMGKLMMDRRVIVSVSLYGLLGFVAIIVNEVMIVFIVCYIT